MAPVPFDKVCTIMAELVCDTNFLIKIANEPLPKFSEFVAVQHFQITTIPAVLRELRGLMMNKKLTLARKASNTYNLIGSKVRVNESGSLADNTDEADVELFEMANSLPADSFVATLDGNLLSRFERNEIAYFTLRHDRPYIRTFRRATYLSTKKH